jgi:hypothetical protein
MERVAAFFNGQFTMLSWLGRGVERKGPIVIRSSLVDPTSSRPDSKVSGKMVRKKGPHGSCPWSMYIMRCREL